MEPKKVKKALTKAERQAKEPFLDALKAYVASNPAPFDVPGHKMGGFDNDFLDYVGKRVYECDVNAPIGMDSLLRPQGVVKEAEALAAEAFGADGCLISVNGTTGGIMTEICGVLRAKDKIILPRNVHKSIINSLIVSGAVPVFVSPDVDPKTGIANGVPVKAYEEAILANPDAKVVFAINPTYFGITSNLKAIADLAHAHGMIAMADEAHGTHFYFDKKYPLGALQAGFDITATSMHKTGGSLTQSSLVLYKGKRVDWNRVKNVFAMLMSTSPSSILMASVDAARKRMFFEGEALLDRTAALCKEARDAIQAIPGLSCLDDSCLDGDGKFGFDPAKLVVNVSGLGLTGFDAYHELKAKYNVQLELGEINCVLAIFGVGTTKEQADRLVMAFQGLSKDYYGKKAPRKFPRFKIDFPELVVRPRVAFNAPSKVVSLKEAEGEISAEAVMVYPPGIPFLVPGEKVTADIVKELRFYARSGGVIISDTPADTVKVIDRSQWFMASDIDNDF